MIDSASVQNQLEKSVVLYNTKDKNAFYSITPEEARFAIEAIKKRRENTHYCQLSTMKNNKNKKHFQKRPSMLCQYISNLQISIENNYSETSVNLRGAIAENSEGEIFDIATFIIDKNIKKSFLLMLLEKIKNDLITYELALDNLEKDNVIKKDEQSITIKDVAIKLLYEYSKRIPDNYNELSSEEKHQLLENCMIENTKDYKKIEDAINQIV